MTKAWVMQHGYPQNRRTCIKYLPSPIPPGMYVLHLHMPISVRWLYTIIQFLLRLEHRMIGEECGFDTFQVQRCEKHNFLKDIKFSQAVDKINCSYSLVSSNQTRKRKSKSPNMYWSCDFKTRIWVCILQFPCSGKLKSQNQENSHKSNGMVVMTYLLF